MPSTQRLTNSTLYAYCVATVSSRKIERACYRDPAFRVLGGKKKHDHSRFSECRCLNLVAPKDLFIQILQVCKKARMVSLSHVGLDGTKAQAKPLKDKA